MADERALAGQTGLIPFVPTLGGLGLVLNILAIAAGVLIFLGR